MLGLINAAAHKRKAAPSIHIDWSLYGGIENSQSKSDPAATGRPWMPHVSQKPLPTDDFLWSLNEEPHRTRRVAILKAHPEVRKLMGHEPLTKYVASAVVIAANRLMAIFANLPVGIPFAMTFKDGIDTDMPTKFEMLLLNNLFFYALRPGFIRVQKLNGWHFLNIGVQFAFDILICYLCGSARPLYYFLMSAFFAGSLHPAAGHFIAEHYMFSNIEQETWSYYGPLNILLYNVGYHNEHHDFPSVPWTRLPALRALAPEFYNVLPYHTSWTMVLLEFIFSKHSGMNMRVKRNPRFKMLAADTSPEDKSNHIGWEVRNTRAD
ncbi:hypothetical protein MEQU1_002530 [Malassezia equina]|uniref:Sphingolipid delta4-desaturase N-terminal domain-containing protein n=1 Tax=Malassezia equina TaxID=1381935 RepID=A0AAF0EJC6_9BASI|nr:hypothetical protein MEQU1_002530 [Malassezia equina]